MGGRQIRPMGLFMRGTLSLTVSHGVGFHSAFTLLVCGRGRGAEEAVVVAMALVVCGDKGHHVTVISKFHGLPLLRAIVFHLNIHGSTVARQFSIDQQHECTGKQVDNTFPRNSSGNRATDS